MLFRSGFIISKMDNLFAKLFRISDAHVNLTNEIARAHEDLKHLSVIFREELKKLFYKLKQRPEGKQSCKAIANQIYWDEERWPRAAGIVKDTWQEIFNEQFVPCLVESGLYCEDCKKPIMAKTVSDRQGYKAYLKKKSYTLSCEDCRESSHIKYAQKSQTIERMMAEKVANLKSLLYSEYLQTDHWQSIRKQALKRARFKCALCSSDGVLHVHHKNYDHLGEEMSSDLIVLCQPCHEKFHNKLPGGEDEQSLS